MAKPAVKESPEFMWKLQAFLNRFRKPYTGVYKNKEIVLDNRFVRNAKFVDCIIIYGGGTVNCNGMNITGSSFSLFGAAGRTAYYLQSLEKCGAHDVLAKTFPYAVAMANSHQGE